MGHQCPLGVKVFHMCSYWNIRFSSFVLFFPSFFSLTFNPYFFFFLLSVPLKTWWLLTKLSYPHQMVGRRGIFWKIKHINVLTTFQVTVLFRYCNNKKKWVNFQIITFPLYVIIISRTSFRVNPHSIVCLNFKELLAWSIRHKAPLSS